MKKQLQNIKVVLIVPFMVLFCVSLYSQKAPINLSALVYDIDSDGFLPCKVDLIEGGRVVKSLTTSKDGELRMILPYDKHFKVRFSRLGYVEKSIDFNTENVPEDDAKYGLTIPVKVYLYKELKGVDFSILKNNPIAKYKFADDLGNFDWEKAYTKSIQAQMAQVVEAYHAALRAAEKAEKLKLQKYNTIVKEADKLFFKKDYITALTKYQEANALYPDKRYPKKRIEDAKANIALQKEQELLYTKKVKEGDELRESKKYNEAFNKYNEAKAIFSKQEVKDKIESLKNEMLALKSQQANYDKYIAQAAGFMDKIKYDEAIVAYEKALENKPNDSFVTGKIAEANKLKKQQEENDKRYKSLLAKGEALSGEKKYKEAISKYKEALELKPTESHPKIKIGEIESIIKGEEGEQAAYKSLIDKADLAFKGGNYNSASDFYKKALKKKPNEEYPQNKLNDIAKEREKEKKIKTLIASGNASYSKEDLKGAKAIFQEVLGLNSEDSYSKKMITKIDNDLQTKSANELMSKQNREKFDELIQLVDNLVEKKEYDKALQNLEQALKLNVSKEVANSKIRSVKKLMSEKESEDNGKEIRFKEAMSGAETFFQEENYTEAKKKYKLALTFKPSAQKAKDRLDEITSIEEGLASAQVKLRKDRERMEMLVEEAEQYVKLKLYDKSKIKYLEALRIIDDEDIKGEIAKLDVLLSKDKDSKEKLAEEREIKEKKYNQLVQDADNNFQKESYQKAISAYEKALGLKPSEEYPKSQIAQARHLWDEYRTQEKDARLKAVRDSLEKSNKISANRSYKSFINRADDLMNSKKYTIAKELYQKASKLKSEEVYPRSQIDLIDKLLVDQLVVNKSNQEYSERKEKYHEVMGRAESLARVYEYDDAISLFERANRIMPEEKHPQERIKQIKDRMEINKRLENKKVKKVSPLLSSEEALIEMEMEKRKKDMEEARNNRINSEIKEYQSRGSEYVEGLDARIKKNELAIESMKESVEKISKEGDKGYLLKVNRVERFRRIFSKRRRERGKKEEERLQASKANLKEYFAKLKKKNDAKAMNYKKFADKMRMLREANQELHASLSELSDEMRVKRKFDYYTGEKRLSSQPDLAKRFSQGVTEEVIKSKNNITLVRTLVVGDHVVVFKKIHYTWGGVFYTRDGYNVSKKEWDTNSTGENYSE